MNLGGQGENFNKYGNKHSAAAQRMKNTRNHSLVVYVEQIGAADAQHVFHGPGALVDGHDGEVAADQPVGFGPHAHGQRLDHHLGRPGLGLKVLGRVQTRGPHGRQLRPATGQRHGGRQRGSGRRTHGGCARCPSIKTVPLSTSCKNYPFFFCFFFF